MKRSSRWRPRRTWFWSGGGAGGIGGIDVERLYWWRQVWIIERAAELAHVDVAHAGVLEVGAADDVLVEGVAAGGGGQEAAAFLGVGADEGGQAGDEARGHGAVCVAGLAAAEADEGGAGIAVGVGEGADIRGGDAGDGCGGLGGVMRQDLLLEFVSSLYVLLEEGAVGEVVLYEHVEDGERKRAVGAGARAEEGVGVVGGLRAVGVDAVDLGAIFAGHLDVVAEVDVGREHTDAPEDDHIAMLGFLRGGRQRRAHDVAIATALGRRADGAVKARGAELVEEGVAGAVADCAHRAGVGVGQDGFGAVVTDDGLPAPRNLFDGFIPADGDKAPFTLLAGAPQRRHDALCGVDRALIVGHLRAERAAREGVFGVARDTDGLAVLNGDEQPAAVGAVVGTDRRLDFVHKDLL